MPRLKSTSGIVRRVKKLSLLLLTTSIFVPTIVVQAQDMELRRNMSEPLVPDILRAQDMRAAIRPARPMTAAANDTIDDNRDAQQGIEPLVDAPLDEAPPPQPRPEPSITIEEAPSTAPANAREISLGLDEEARQNLREPPTGSIEHIAAASADEDFAAPGVALGTFLLRPMIEQGLTATSNADGSATGNSAIISETTLRLGADSNWSRHSAQMTGTTTWRRSLSGQHLKDVRGRLDAVLDLDLDHEWQASARLGYEAAPQSASSPLAIPGIASQPTRHQINGGISVEKSVGKLRLGLSGESERSLYQDARLAGGGTLSQKHRNSTLYTARLRTGYEISPALTPFMQIEGGRRLYDEATDPGGYRRSSDRTGASIGTEFNLGEKFSGEIAAGWLRESFDDDRLNPLSAATIDANIRWSPQRGTDLGLRGSTSFEGATAPGESGSVLYTLQLNGQRQIRANLIADALLGFEWRNYSGSNERDLIYTAQAGLTWWMNRYAGLTMRARHETLNSNIAGRDTRTNSLFLGITGRR
ncbi:outer membrane beta-barrel protein [Aquamicrobium segne]|uniref:Outer membrane beta-barrel protein n=1 Tax=Aquamicrobium segne TaxID=469547 RepID=A0ABW0GY60_9HYPH